MEQQTKFYIGIDVSKLWFDLSLLPVIEHQKTTMLTERFENTKQGLQMMDKWLKKHTVSFNENTLMVIENTGVYHRLIWSYCSNNNLSIYIGNAAHIKWSFGITRGKNDIIDSQRLCNYAHKHAEELRATPALNPVFMKLKDLMTARTKLLSSAGSISAYLKELKPSNDKQVQKIMETSHKAALDGLRKSIVQIEEQIKKIIAEDKDLQNNYDLLLTVPGIGHFTALYIICCTSNFINKISGKQLASYAGVVPFENRSGISIKGRNRVHPMANKELKKMLHLCSLTAIRYYPEFQQYYLRKKAEGKHTMSVLNAIKNKIILRAVAVVNKQEAYVDNTKIAA
jgi:transposase